MIEHEGVAGGPAPDDRIDAALRDHFASQKMPVPSFEQAFVRAQSQAQARAAGGGWIRRWHLPETGLAAAALLLAVFLFMPWGEVADQDELRGYPIAPAEPTGLSGLDDRQLYADLERTTRWTAPSDRWWGADPPQMPGGLPDFSNMKFDLKENLKWSQLDG